MNVLVIGSGGREHALVWKLKQSPRLTKIYCTPGNPGIELLAECSPVSSSDLQKLLGFAREKEVDLTVVGPEQPLAEGIVDLFETNGLKVFGPTKLASQLEWSKAFAKGFMRRHGIPTAQFATFSAAELNKAVDYLESGKYPLVLKADGLAAGKGVVICNERESAFATMQLIIQAKVFGETNDTVVIEEYLTGEEASVFAICDGSSYVTLAPAQDHKRVFDDDQGKNTGGMGAYAPAPVVTPAILEQVKRTIIEPTLSGMRAEGRAYKGCLYVGLIVTSEGPKVIEYNSRFGDPETQAVLPLYEGDFLELLDAACEERIVAEAPIDSAVHGSAVCVVLASGGYPDKYETGKVIGGLDELAGVGGIVAFHAGTRKERGAVVTSGGRVLGITAMSDSPNLDRTIKAAYEGVRMVSFDGMHYRRDIGRKALARKDVSWQG